jgi:L-ascorbate metabolism protein UlaG (beta-lactamase superfamily)
MSRSLAFLGHAALDVRMGGVRVCVDPHRPGALGGRFQLPEITGPFDAIVSTHRHEDHAGWTPTLGTTLRLDPPATIGDLRLDGRPAFHDRDGGVRMGLVRMVSLLDGALRVVHLGDLAAWDGADVAWLAGADVVAIPVGGTYTLDGAEAAALCRRIAPRVAVPIHAADPRVDLPLQPVAPFLDALGWPAVRLAELDLAALPTPGTVVVLDPP